MDKIKHAYGESIFQNTFSTLKSRKLAVVLTRAIVVYKENVSNFDIKRLVF
jgi:hypothetical protein